MSVSEDGATIDVRARVDAIYRADSRRVLATLIRLLGDFDRAEEAMHEAFALALERWAQDGVPNNPAAWIISTARFKSIDATRRDARLDASAGEIALHVHPDVDDQTADDEHDVGDDRLRLIFTCCHPALSPEAQLALTLREVCGLTTEEIAHAFLVAPSTVAQRIVRAKAKIRGAHIPYQIPGVADLTVRLDAVLQVVYLVFNEGYSATIGTQLTRRDLSEEAIRLGRLLRELLPDPEVDGLLALMLLHESRRTSRTTTTGELVLLDDQDRSTWDQSMIREGGQLVQRALVSRRFGPYTLQAAIAAVHAEATTAAATDWRQIVGLYDVLLRVDDSPVVALNRAVALAMRDTPEAGLAAIDEILGSGALHDYHLAYAARAHMCRRLGRVDDARAAYAQALAYARQEPERRFIARQIAELAAG